MLLFTFLFFCKYSHYSHLSYELSLHNFFYITWETTIFISSNALLYFVVKMRKSILTIEDYLRIWTSNITISTYNIYQGTWFMEMLNSLLNLNKNNCNSIKPKVIKVIDDRRKSDLGYFKENDCFQLKGWVFHNKDEIGGSPLKSG